MTCDEWVRGDQVVHRPKALTKKQSPSWLNGFDQGLAALAVCLQGNGAVLLVHGARVFVHADHHIDEAILAARARFRAPPAKSEQDS